MQVQLDITLDQGKVFSTLIIIEVALLLVDTIVNCCGLVSARDLRRLLDITLEANLATWFSSTQLLVTGLVAACLVRLRRAQGLRNSWMGWTVLAVFFIYMGIDDAAQIHERLATVTADALKESESESLVTEAVRGFRSYYWQLLFLPVFGALGLFMMVFLFRELNERRTLLLFIGGISCYVLAVGLDYFDGIDSNYDVIIARTNYSFDQAQHLFRAVEEFIEMLGTTLFLTSFLQHLGGIQLRSSEGEAGVTGS